MKILLAFIAIFWLQVLYFNTPPIEQRFVKTVMVTVH